MQQAFSYWLKWTTSKVSQVVHGKLGAGLDTKALLETHIPTPASAVKQTAEAVATDSTPAPTAVEPSYVAASPADPVAVVVETVLEPVAEVVEIPAAESVVDPQVASVEAPAAQPEPVVVESKVEAEEPVVAAVEETTTKTKSRRRRRAKSED